MDAIFLFLSFLANALQAINRSTIALSFPWIMKIRSFYRRRQLQYLAHRLVVKLNGLILPGRTMTKLLQLVSPYNLRANWE
jgi:hypothetical protein